MVFVEVKTRQFNYANSLNSEEVLTLRKVRRLQ